MPPFGLSTSILYSHHDAISEPLTTTITLLSSLVPSISMRGIQKVGENTFAAMFVVALMQALVALIQYRTNPSGQLIVPPGLTVGVASPADDSMKEQNTTNGVSTSKELNVTESNKSTISTAANQYARIIRRFNRFLFLLIPWASRRIAFIWGRNTHVMHLGFILSLNRLFDIPNGWWAAHEESLDLPTATDTGKLPERVVVIGDSLAVGLGSVEEFDSEKDNSVPYMRLENVENDAGPGPVFPKALAATISTYSGTPVSWRSAGVDGGDVKLIEEFCFKVIEEEAAEGRPPDLVVILCGANDLKSYVSNPFKKEAGPRVFRARLIGLICRIKEVAPNAKVVIPSFPTQMFHKHSPLNIFPLNFFLDTVIGFWDSQKKMVADALPSEIMYFEIDPAEIFDWHEFEDGKDRHGSTLIAADGVHPNAKCYRLWANSLGTRIATSIDKTASKRNRHQFT